MTSPTLPKLQDCMAQFQQQMEQNVKQVQTEFARRLTDMVHLQTEEFRQAMFPSCAQSVPMPNSVPIPNSVPVPQPVPMPQPDHQSFQYFQVPQSFQAAQSPPGIKTGSEFAAILQNEFSELLALLYHKNNVKDTLKIVVPAVTESNLQWSLFMFKLLALYMRAAEQKFHPKLHKQNQVKYSTGPFLFYLDRHTLDKALVPFAMDVELENSQTSGDVFCRLCRQEFSVSEQKNHQRSHDFGDNHLSIIRKLNGKFLFDNTGPSTPTAVLYKEKRTVLFFMDEVSTVCLVCSIELLRRGDLKEVLNHMRTHVKGITAAQLIGVMLNDSGDLIGGDLKTFWNI